MLGADYFEGVRAMVIDKDRRPRWSPASIGELDPAAVDACFTPLRAGYELTFA
jgi:enoyl-CoA hydratase